eukprot:3328462-Amphidinium_carterae.1
MASGSKLADLRLMIRSSTLASRIMPSISSRDILHYLHVNGLLVPSDLQEAVLTGSVSVWPCFTAVPMGWKWAMCIAQRIHTRIGLEGSGLDSGCVLRTVLEEGVIPGVVRDDIPFLLPYVDNLNVLGSSAEVVNSVLHKIVGKLRASGFTVHEIESATCTTSVLGYEVDGEYGTISCKSEKLTAVREAWLRLSRGLPVSGHGLEKLLGFSVHFMLLFLPLLSIPQQLYRFAREDMGTRPLWPSARREAFLLSQLLLFCSCSVRQEICPLLSVSDASLTGYAVCTSHWAQADVEQVARNKEHFRYKAVDPAYTRAGASALSDFGDVFFDINTVIPRVDQTRGEGIDHFYRAKPDFCGDTTFAFEF